MKRLWPILPVLLVLIRCVPLGGGPPSDTSKSFAYATFKEQQGRITVLLDSLPASFRDDQAYIPIPVAIGLQGYGDGIIITPETFILVDQAGLAHPAASYGELVRGYSKLRFDGSLVQGRPVTSQQFVFCRLLPSSFYPPGPGRKVERVHLDAYTWIRDVIYFPRPDSGLGGVLALRLSGGGVDPPLEVRFRIPLRGVKIR